MDIFPLWLMGAMQVGESYAVSDVAVEINIDGIPAATPSGLQATVDPRVSASIEDQTIAATHIPFVETEV